MDDNPGSAQTPPPAAAQPASPPTPEQAAEESPSPKRKWFPSALTVLVIVLLDELERAVVAEAEFFRELAAQKGHTP